MKMIERSDFRCVSTETEPISTFVHRETLNGKGFRVRPSSINFINKNPGKIKMFATYT